MTQMLVTGDENAGQILQVPTQQRPEGMVITTQPIGGGAAGQSFGIHETAGALTNPIDSVFRFLDDGTFAAYFPNANWGFNSVSGACTRTLNDPASTAWLVIMSFTVQLDAGEGITFGIDVDGDLVGQGFAFQPSIGQVLNNTAVSQRYLMTVMKLCNPVAGSVVSPVALAGAAVDILTCDITLAKVA